MDATETRELLEFAAKLKTAKHEMRDPRSYEYSMMPVLTDSDREAQRLGELIEQAVKETLNGKAQ